MNHSHSCVGNIMQVHSRLNPTMQTTICLSRFSNSLPLSCNVHMVMKWSFMGCNVDLKVREKRWTNNLEYVELKAMKTMKQALINQHENEHYKHSTPNQKQSPQWIGNELTMHIIHSHSFSCLLYTSPSPRD